MHKQSSKKFKKFSAMRTEHRLMYVVGQGNIPYNIYISHYILISILTCGIPASSKGSERSDNFGKLNNFYCRFPLEYEIDGAKLLIFLQNTMAEYRI